MGGKAETLADDMSVKMGAGRGKFLALKSEVPRERTRKGVTEERRREADHRLGVLVLPRRFAVVRALVNFISF